MRAASSSLYLPYSLAFLSILCDQAATSFLIHPHSNVRNTRTSLRNSANENNREDEVNKFLEKVTNDLFISNSNRSNLPASLDKSALYSQEEMQNILMTHFQIQDDIYVEETIESSFSLHDMVMQAVGDDTQSSETDIPKEFHSKTKRIRAIVTDVDGTLLTSSQTLHSRTRQAVLRAISLSSSTDPQSFHFFPATGKSRKGAFQSLGDEVANHLRSGFPGVFLQGLYCVNDKAEVVFERKVERDALAAVQELALELEISIVGYDGDDLFTDKVTPVVRHLHEHYGESMPSTTSLPLYERGFHKLLLIDEDQEKLSRARPRFEKLAEENGATLTQALPTMLEILPHGCSKALGVQKVCEAMGIDPSSELLALGDAENDAHMLEMAAIGVAMGNGCPIAKNSADYVMDFTNDEGGAGFAMEMFGFRNEV